MQDDVNWKLSLLLDDELESEEAIGLLEQIHGDPELQAKWYGYQVIRQALQTGSGIQPHPGFLERVRGALEEETPSMPSNPPYPDPQPSDFRRYRFNRWAMPFAVAAAIAMVAVIIGKKMLDPAASPPQTIEAKPRMIVAQPPVYPAEVRPNRRRPGYSRLEDYLLVHSEDSLYWAGPQHMLGYARIVSHADR
ncbi:MAG: sigma-E factor negative regulatory protein [Methylohalobius sp. ZOD2]